LSGWTWDYVEETVTVERMMAMYDEWRINPPLTLMVKAYLGIKGESPAAEQPFEPPAFLNLPDFEE
jgi:hypothetical protein